MTPRVRSQLGEFFRIKHGYAFKGEFFNDAGPWILTTPGNFFEAGGLKERGDKAKRYDGPVPEDFILRPDDLVIAMTDLKQTAPILGASALIRTDSQYLHNQRIGKVIDLDEIRIHKKYLFYVFNWQEVRAQIRGSATGSTVRHTAPERIYSVSAPIPPLPTQRRIASILSAYDDLIENNTKRIEILEEMARSLYREWFVHFRFPGHEKVKLVDSELGKIPEGWKVRPLRDSCIKIGSGATPRGGKSAYQETGLSLIRSLNIYNYRFSDDGLAFIDEGQASKLSNVEVMKEDVLLNITGASVGRCTMVPARILPARVNQHVAILRADPNVLDPYFLLMAINFEGNKQQLMNAAQGGATREAITKGHLERFKVALPNRALMRMAGENLGSFQRQRDLLAHKNEVLRQTRDLLLPKLISGEIDVDPLDLPEASS